MWTRKELKDKAKATLKMNYWKTVLIALLISLFAGTLGSGAAGGAAGGVGGSAGAMYANSYSMTVETGEFTDEEIDQIVEQYGIDPSALDDPDMSVEELMESVGMPSEPYEETVISPVMTIALLLIIGAIILVALAVAIAIDAFLINPFLIGGYRFSVRNLNTPAMVSEAGYGFDNNYREIVKTMLLRDIFIALWTLLLIIPGIVKSYSYRMVPYILIDHPELSPTETITLSRKMMDGQKFDAFVLDLSFIGWIILSVLTLGLVGVFWYSPYKYNTNAALYLVLKKNVEF